MDNDAISDIEGNIVKLELNSKYDYNHSIIYTINSITDANQFCNTYNHNNNYNGLKLGQRIQINDGTYNKTWYIAGFDCEYNHTASDGSIKDNGYGICLIPENGLIEDEYDDHTSSIFKGYASSTIHMITLPTISDNLKNVLGSHLIDRNVLLSSDIDSNTCRSNKYIWTTAYCTLMSGYQLTGEIAKYSNKYDDGEANYKLPLYNYMSYYNEYIYRYWTRGIYGLYGGADDLVWVIYNDGSISNSGVTAQITSVIPLIYIR